VTGGGGSAVTHDPSTPRSELAFREYVHPPFQSYDLGACTSLLAAQHCGSARISVGHVEWLPSPGRSMRECREAPRLYLGEPTGAASGPALSALLPQRALRALALPHRSPAPLGAGEEGKPSSRLHRAWLRG
jgi:hypothetical protein